MLLDRADAYLQDVGGLLVFLSFHEAEAENPSGGFGQGVDDLLDVPFSFLHFLDVLQVVIFLGGGHAEVYVFLLGLLLPEMVDAPAP